MDMFDVLMAKSLSGGGGAAPTLITKNITANGSYAASDDDADGYSAVTVDVANTYTAQDESKVVSSGALVAQTSTTVTENGTVDTTLINSVEVNVPTGGGGAAEKDVNFYDYDGVVVASYTAAEFAELTAMPNNPTHEGLTAQGWNWSLSDAKTYVASYGKLNVGQMYITSDGKTRLYIRLGEGRLKPYLGLTGNSSGTVVSIDWGDNSPSQSVTLNTSTVYTPHNYATVGDYVIAITVTNGSISFTGNSSTNSNIFRKSATPSGFEDTVYCNTLTKIEIGSSVTSIGDYAFSNCKRLTSVTIPSSLASFRYMPFYYCSSLNSITIPSGVTSIGEHEFNYCSSLCSITIPSSVTYVNNNAFQGCNLLKSVTIPSGVTSIGTYAFSYCNTLTSVTIPSSVTSIGAYAFYVCGALTEVTIPSSVTSINNNAFQNCYGLGFIKFERSTPPTVYSNTFNGVPTDCIIYVPTGSLSAYTSANNYPSSSTYTYVEY